MMLRILVMVCFFSMTVSAAEDQKGFTEVRILDIGCFIEDHPTVLWMSGDDNEIHFKGHHKKKIDEHMDGYTAFIHKDSGRLYVVYVDESETLSPAESVFYVNQDGTGVIRYWGHNKTYQLRDCYFEWVKL